MTTPAVSAAVGVACLVGAALIWVVGHRHSPRLVVALAMTGTIGILPTPAGHWLHNAVNSANNLLAHGIGQLFGTTIGFIPSAIAVYFVAHRVWRRQIDDRVVIVAAALPLLVTLIPGAAGNVISAVVFGLGNAIGFGVGAPFGLR